MWENDLEVKAVDFQRQGIIFFFIMIRITEGASYEVMNCVQVPSLANFVTLDNLLKIFELQTPPVKWPARVVLGNYRIMSM